MLEIKKFPHKHKCQVRSCKNLDVYTIGEENEHPAFTQLYCKDTLLEMAEVINQFFSSDGETKRINPEELQARIDELTSQNEELQKQATELEQIKSEFESAKASADLFKEKLGELESENEKLKKENKSLKKKAETVEDKKTDSKTEESPVNSNEGKNANGDSN